MREHVTRRDWLVLSGLAARSNGSAAAKGARTTEEARAVPAGPAEPVSVAKVRSYDEDLTAQFRKMFDQIGGIDNQVKGKTVGIKVNLTGGGRFPGIHGGRHALGAPPRGRRGGRRIRRTRRQAHPHSRKRRRSQARLQTRRQIALRADGTSPPSAMRRPWSNSRTPTRSARPSNTHC